MKPLWADTWRMGITVRSARGVTFVEITIALVILGLLAAVVFPTVASYSARQRAEETAEVFVSLGLSLNNNNNPLGKKGFINSVVDPTKSPQGTYPSRLRDLTIAITTTVATHRDCAGAAYTAAKVVTWTANAPFSGLLITPGVGVTTPMGVIRDSVYKGAGNTAGLVELRMDSVATEDADNLDYFIDKAADAAAGQLRYIQSAAGPARPDLHLIKYVLPGAVGC